MNWVIPQSFGAISKRFRETPIENTLAGGIAASFGVLTFKGKVWAVRYRGTVTPILAENGRDPAYSVEICLLKSSPAVSKTFYDSDYVEGKTDPPDCMSTNGIVPDVGVPKKQAPACATCPNNAWGSRRTPDGKNAKACADNKRLAVVMMPNMLDERFGGPLLLRVPPASLQNLASYGNALAQHGYHEHSIVTRVAFDMKEAYQRFVFSPVRPLSDAEADMAIDLRQSSEVSRILAEALEYVSPAEQRETFFEQPPKGEVVVPSVFAPTAKRPQKTITMTPAVPASPALEPEPTSAELAKAKGQAMADARARETAEKEKVEWETGPEARAAALAKFPSQAKPAGGAGGAGGAVPATPTESDTDGIPAFLRKGKEAPTEEIDDDAFLDEIDSKLAAMLPK